MTTGHDFQWALTQLKEGKKVRRREEPDIVIRKVIFANTDTFPRLASNDGRSWVPWSSELFATDWELAK